MRDALWRAGITGRKILRGDVYWVSDEKIILPEERLPNKPKRTLHDGRPVVVLQTDMDNSNPHYPIVLVAPTSHRVEFKDDKDVILPVVAGGLPQEGLLLLGLIQPLLKTDLERCIYTVDPVTMSSVDAVIAANLGLIERP